MLIKRADTDQDIRNLTTLAEQIWHEHFTPIIGKAQVEYMVEKFQSYAAVKQAVQEDSYTYFMIYDDNNDLSGYCGLRPDSDDEGSLFLSKLYVRKESRGKGFSRALLAAARLAFPERKRIWLTVNRYNDNTIAVYRHMGFSVIREQKTDIGGGFVMDDYVMEKIF